jgi:hypothetical protein
MHLFKYLRPGRVDVLEKNMMVYSRPSSFNDPFDCLPHIKESNELNPLGSRMYFLQARPEDIGSPRLREEIMDHVRRSIALDSSYSMDFVSLIEPLPQEFHGDFARAFRTTLGPTLRDSVVVLSLTENANNLLMWAHYAADHTGFAVGFCSGHEFFNSAGSNPSNPGFLSKVVYSESRPSGVAGAMSSENSYLTKGLEWSYEEEWRILQRANNANFIREVNGEKIHLFAYPPDAVTKVIIGARATAETRDRIKAILSDKLIWPNVSLFQAEVDQKHYKINYNVVDR